MTRGLVLREPLTDGEHGAGAGASPTPPPRVDGTPPAVPPPPARVAAAPTSASDAVLPRVVAVLAVVTALVGLLLFAVDTDWRLLLWPEFALVPVGAWGILAATRGRGGPTIAAGVLAIATHGETWLASLQGTIEGDLLVGGGADLLAWPTVAQNGAESLLVIGGAVAVVAGVRLVATGRP